MYHTIYLIMYINIFKLFRKINDKNKEFLNSTINYWLLEQEKHSKRSFMYPHLSMLLSNRFSSYQHRINFLKINQLGFLYSNGFLKKNTIINEFLNKILKMNNTLLRNLENIKSDQSKIMHCKQAGHNNMNIVTENSENNSIVEITHSSNYFSNLIPSSEDIFRNIPQFLDNL